MIEKLQSILKNKHEYDLGEYACYEITREKSKILLVTSILFAIFAILFILDATGIFANFMSLGILLFLVLILLIIPMALRKGGKYEAIIVTPLHLIQRTGKMEFTILTFDKITKFNLTKEGINVKEGHKSILLGLDMFREEIDPIIDILEAKGKTFDPEKDYMIRPIEVKIVDNKISIIDIETETETKKIFSEYAEEYEMLTPGFFEEIIFRNSMVDDVTITEKDLILHLNSFEVKGGHPENTTFDILLAKDCVLIFEGIKLNQLLLQDLNKKDEPDMEVDLTLVDMQQYLENAVISHWKKTGKKIDMYFATGINLLKTSFEYNEVIIGWNK